MHNVLLNLFLREEKKMYYIRHLKKEHSFNEYVLSFRPGTYRYEQRDMVGINLLDQNSKIFQCEERWRKLKDRDVQILLLESIILSKNKRNIIHKLNYFQEDELMLAFDKHSQILYCYAKSFAEDIVKAILRNVSLPIKRMVEERRFVMNGVFEILFPNNNSKKNEAISIFNNKIIIGDNKYTLSGGNDAIVKMTNQNGGAFLSKVVYFDDDKNMEIIIYNQEEKKMQDDIVINLNKSKILQKAG